MKKSILLAAFACLAVACQTRLEEDFVTESPAAVIRATMEDTDTRTVLQPGEDGVSTVLWSEADEIAVFLDGASQPSTFTLTEGAGTKQGVFTGEGKGQDYVAFYPKKMVSSLVGDNVRINLPAEQSYQEGSFANGSYPMLASGTSSSLQFSNLASVLRLSLTGKHSVTRIVFTSAQKSIKVCGQATASVSSKQLSLMTNGRDSVILNVGGVQLKENEATHFYLVLPPQTYKGGFTVRVYTGERYMDKAYTRDFTMVRSRMHKADAFAFKPNGVDVSSSLNGSGTENDPFLIEEIGDLLCMQEAVNTGASINDVEASTAAYKLMADIDLGAVCGEGKKNWTPIGLEEHFFGGSFDGNGHRISGVYINSTEMRQGLFGYVDSGKLANLSVQGKVVSSADRVALLVADCQYSTVDNCSAEGYVKGRYYTGGIVGNGSDARLVSRCVNRADVDGYYDTAGVVGLTYGTITDCINYGSISGFGNTGGVGGCAGNGIFNSVNYGSISATGDKTGGVAGNQNADVVANCRNEGTVTGRSAVGGITGYSRQGSYLWNNVNRGKVSGEQYVGGVCGHLSSNSSAWGDPTTLRNGVNLGEVVCTTAGEAAGSVCGFNEGENTQKNYLSSELSQAYWLYDSTKGLGMAVGIGQNEGVSSDYYSLTDDEMKGAECSVVLYKTYNRILDALNGWAYQNVSRFSNYPLWGWTADEKDGYPTLTGLDAQRPGSDGSVFTVTPASVQLASALGGEFSVEVTSSAEYQVDTPEWITPGEVVFFETNRFVKTHHFSAGINDGDKTRNGVITFTTTEGKVLTVSVKQVNAYLKTDLADLFFAADGATKRFSVTASIGWRVTADAAWVTVEPASGSGDSVVGVRAAANESSNAREATVLLSSEDGSITYSARIVQSGKAPDDGQELNWKEADFVHQSVAMRFTATWCGWCPRMNKTIHRAQELYPDKIQHLALHGGGSDLQFDQVGGLMTLYSIGGFPTGIVDGRTVVNNSEIESTAQTVVQIVKETEETYGTLTGAAIGSSVSGRNATINVDAYLKKAGDYKLTVLLVEDGIINSQTDYEEGDHARYTHDCVARVAVTDVLGESFSVAEDFSVKQFGYNVTVPATFNMANMRVFVYIQRAFGNYPVIQTSSSYGNYFIDNCATVELGSSLKLALDGGIGGGGDSGGGDGNEGITPGGDIDM